MSSELPIVGVTMGDPAGVGSEIIVEAYSQVSSEARLVILGDVDVMADAIEVCEVKLLFRELRKLYDLDGFDTSNPAVVQIRLYASVLTLLVSRELLALAIEHADEDAVFPSERRVCDRKVAAQRILKRLSNYLDYSPPPLLDRMAADAQKIHQQRPVLQERFATAAQPTAGVS